MAQKNEQLLYTEKIRKGETTLHVAIVNIDNNVFFQRFCDQLKQTGKADSILETNVQLAGRKGTPMLGELPIFVAALTLDIEKVQAILTIDKGCLRNTNSKGDTIIHSLIRLAPYRPDARNEILEMIGYIYEVAKRIDKEPHWEPPKVGIKEKNRARGSTRIQTQQKLPDDCLLYYLFLRDNHKGFSPLELATTWFGTVISQRWKNGWCIPQKGV